MNKKIRAFTLIELMVVMTILSILSLVGYMSYSDSIIDARDSQRINDLEKLRIDLKSHKQKEGSYPLPIDPIDITNSGTVVYQGILTDSILSNVLKDVPKDPRTGSWYWYSTLKNRQQFQLALTTENGGSLKAVVKGDYKSVAKNLFPTLLFAVTGSTSFEVNTNSGRFILNGGSYNLPYDMEGTTFANDTLDFTQIVAEMGVTIETGGNYISCLEVYEAGRSVGPGFYQIVNSGSALVEDTDCPMSY